MGIVQTTIYDCREILKWSCARLSHCLLISSLSTPTHPLLRYSLQTISLWPFSADRPKEESSRDTPIYTVSCSGQDKSELVGPPLGQRLFSLPSVGVSVKP